MNKIRFIIVIALILNLNSVLASKVRGYIIRNSSDTIFGEVKVSFFDIYTGGIVFYGINLEQLHSTLYFRENNKNRFKAFTPNEISGFGFIYKSINYRFKTFVIESKSIVKSERKRLRFLNLIYQGKIAVYKDIVRKENYIKTSIPFDKVIDYYDYYLFDDKHGLKRAIWTKEYKTLKDLFRYYEIDQKFVEQLPADARFKDIKVILHEYETWKKNNSIKMLQT
jgi:hypothetical protein